MTGCYGNQASVLDIRGILAVEKVVTQLDHITLQGEGEGREGEGREKEGQGGEGRWAGRGREGGGGGTYYMYSETSHRVHPLRGGTSTI